MFNGSRFALRECLKKVEIFLIFFLTFSESRSFSRGIGLLLILPRWEFQGAIPLRYLPLVVTNESNIRSPYLTALLNRKVI
jgi:hypothetical protein